MNQAYYQISSLNAYYVRRWIPGYMRRTWKAWNYSMSRSKYTTKVGFDKGYEYGYCLGVF